MISRLISYSCFLVMSVLIQDVLSADPEPATGALKGHKGTLSCLAYSRDGKLLASGAKDGPVRVWDVDKCKPSRILEGHDGLVRSLAHSADDKWLVTAGRDGKLLVWDYTTGKIQAAMDEGAMGFQVLAFSTDGRTLATGGIDRNVTLWNFDRLLQDHPAK
jgi:WD40 repeat protein